MIQYTSYSQAMKEQGDVALTLKSLKEINTAIFKVPNLKVLKLKFSYSCKEEIRLPKEIEQAQKLKYLEVEGDCMVELCEELFKLPALEEVRISSGGLQKLPANIGESKQLKTLYVSGNYSNKSKHLSEVRSFELPTSLGELEALEELEILYVPIKTLPGNIGQLKKLTSLSLKTGQLTALPESLGNCTSLTRISIQDQQLTRLPDVFSNLRVLRVLSLTNNKLEVLPDSLGACTALEEFSVQKNQLKSIPESLANYEVLKRVYLNNNILEDLPAALAGWKSLYHASLGHNQFKVIPAVVYQWTKLQVLSLSNNELKELGAALTELQALEVLNLNYNQFSSLPDSLAALPQLAELKIDQNQFKEPPLVLAELTHLQKLDFYNWIGFDRDDYKKVMAWITNLETTKEERLELWSLWWMVYKDRPATISVSSYLKALQASVDKYQLGALDHLTTNSDKAFDPAQFNTNSVLHILVKTNEKKTTISKKLKALGIGYRSKWKEDVTHVVISGKWKGEDLDVLLEAGVYFVAEGQLIDFLTAAKPEFLTEQTDDAQFSIENVQRLIESMQAENWELAVEFMKGGGVPKELETDLLAIHKLADDTKLRAKAGRLLKKGASADLLLGLKEAPSFTKKLQDYYYYEYASDTFGFGKAGIDLVRLAYLLMLKANTSKMASYLLVEGDATYRRLTAEFLKQKMGTEQSLKFSGPGLAEELVAVFAGTGLQSLTLRTYTGAFNPPRLMMSDLFPANLAELESLEQLTVQPNSSFDKLYEKEDLLLFIEQVLVLPKLKALKISELFFKGAINYLREELPIKLRHQLKKIELT